MLYPRICIFKIKDYLWHRYKQYFATRKIGLNIAFEPDAGDLRINDLAIEEQNLLFDFWGYHTKDYATYLWPLLEQIDAKLAKCN